MSISKAADLANLELLLLQASLRRNPAPDPRRDPSLVGSQVGSLTHEVGQKGLFLGRAYYGCVATVLPSVSPGLSRKVSTHPTVVSPTHSDIGAICPTGFYRVNVCYHVVTDSLYFRDPLHIPDVMVSGSHRIRFPMHGPSPCWTCD